MGSQVGAHRDLKALAMRRLKVLGDLVLLQMKGSHLQGCYHQCLVWNEILAKLLLRAPLAEMTVA